MPFTVHTNDLAPSTADSDSAGTTLIFSPTAAVPVDKLALALIIWDNVDGDNADNTTKLSVSDAKGNFWDRSAECQFSEAGAALDGVLVGVFHSEITTQIETTDTITVASTATGTAKGATLLTFNYEAATKIVGVAGKAYQRVAASTSYSVTVSGLQSEEHLWIGVNAIELAASNTNGIDLTFTLITQGTFASFGSEVGGTAAVGARAGYKIAVDNGETYDRATLVSADRATLLVAFRETEIGEGQSHPTRRSMVA